MSVLSIIFWTAISVSLLYTVFEYIAVKSKNTSLPYRIIRRMFWKSIMNKLVKNTSPLLAYPMLVEMSLSDNLKNTYINNGTDALIDAFIKVSESKLDSLVKTVRHPKRAFSKTKTISESIDFMRKIRESERTGLDFSEIEFIENFEKNNKT